MFGATPLELALVAAMALWLFGVRLPRLLRLRGLDFTAERWEKEPISNFLKAIGLISMAAVLWYVVRNTN